MTIDPDDIRALVGYLEQRDGIADMLACGCHGTTECGYHQEQRERIAAGAPMIHVGTVEEG